MIRGAVIQIPHFAVEKHLGGLGRLAGTFDLAQKSPRRLGVNTVASVKDEFPERCIVVFPKLKGFW
jgi:hypothetical protein